MIETVNLGLIQERIANTSIGASTLRSQGKGTIGKAREFLKQLDMEKLREIKNSQEFNRWLNFQTETLMKQFPGEAKNNWGAARKSINVFLENAFYDRFLYEEYGLEHLESLLEVPLDGNMFIGLLENTKKLTKKDWKGIKHLTKADRLKLQECAQYLAEREGVPRIYLDLFYWRSGKKFPSINC